jgi:predicted RNA methylase
MCKAVLDVGAVSGILAFFAAQAGAREVYAIETTSMAEHASMLVTANGLANRIQVIKSKVEALELPEEYVAPGTSGFKLFVRVFFSRGVVVFGLVVILF